MNEHTAIQQQLYDYLTGDLSAGEHERVRTHLTSCPLCARELDSLQSVLGKFPARTNNPAEEQPAEFWTLLKVDVERTIRSRELQTGRGAGRFLDAFLELPLFRPRVAMALGGMLVMIIAGTVTWEYLRTPAPPPAVAEGMQAPPVSVHDSAAVPPVDARLSRYIRKSKTLLVGLANMKDNQDHTLNLDAERRTSRELVQEARFLRQQPLDDLSADLINDLEKIQIKLANIQEENDAPDVEIIRSGIRRENLLFKIRVAETLHERAVLATVRHVR